MNTEEAGSYLGCAIVVVSVEGSEAAAWFLCTHYGAEDWVTYAIALFVSPFILAWPIAAVTFVAFFFLVMCASFLADMAATFRSDS